MTSVNGSINGREDEGDKHGEGLGGGGGEAETEPLFDDPKYVSAAWAKETVVKTQVCIHLHDMSYTPSPGPPVQLMRPRVGRNSSCTMSDSILALFAYSCCS